MEIDIPSQIRTISNHSIQLPMECHLWIWTTTIKRNTIQECSLNMFILNLGTVSLLPGLTTPIPWTIKCLTIPILNHLHQEQLRNIKLLEDKLQRSKWLKIEKNKMTKDILPIQVSMKVNNRKFITRKNPLQKRKILSLIVRNKLENGLKLEKEIILEEINKLNHQIKEKKKHRKRRLVCLKKRLEKS